MAPSDIALTLLLVVYCSGALALYAYGVNCYVMIQLFRRRRDEQRKADAELLEEFAARYGDDDLPIVTTQLPIFNEKFVVERLVRSVCAFDYPKGKHEIQLLDDSTDETREIAAALVARLRAEGHDIHHLHREDRQGYKAGALAEGLKVARGEHVAIFDADFVPPPDFLRRTVPFLMMDPECAFVQTRWGHRNRDFSILTKAQAIGIDGHFVVEQSARAWNGLFLNFNGTAGIWRKRAIAAAGGWQADTITEDLDLSYRVQLAGWRGRFLFDVITPAEIPTDINAFKSQQHRWAKGSIQTAIKLLPTVLRRRDVSRFKRLQAVLHLTHYLVHPTMLLMTVLVLPLLLWGSHTFIPEIMIPLLVLMMFSLAAPSTLYLFSQRAAYGSAAGAIKHLPALMVLGVGLAVNNTRGVIEALTGRRRGEFVRTPKLGPQAEVAATGAPRRARSGAAYRMPANGFFLIEIVMGVWATAAFATYTNSIRFLIGPLLLLHSIGFTVVGVMSVFHDTRAKRLRT